MSIIHEALKKAAVEGASESPKVVVGGDALTASANVSGGYLWVKVGLFILILPVFFLSARYLSSLSLSQLNQPSTPLSLSSGSDRINPKTSPPNHLENGTPSPDNSSDKKAFQDANIKEGEQMLARGVKLYHDGKMNEASDTFRKTVQLLPLSPIAHNNFGMVLRHQGQTTEALGHYKEAIRLDPNYAEAENNIGLIYDQLGSVDEAAIHYKRAIDLKPTFPSFHLNYATLLERKGDFPNARKEYLIYLSLETDHQSNTISVVRSHLNNLKGF